MRKRITVIGDLMIDVDHSVIGTTHREGRTCIHVRESRRRLGTAGAVAQMVAALNVDVMLVATAFIDDMQWVRRQVPGNSFILGTSGITTRRERFYDDENWEVSGPRLDFDSETQLDRDDHARLASRACGSAADAFIVCDHARGVVTDALMDQLRAARKPVFVDPHPHSEWAAFRSVEALVMNRQEALAATQAEPAPKHIISKMDQDGLWWYQNGWQLAETVPGEFDSHRLHFPSMAREIVDTIGAGDQFIAALACARVNGDDMATAIVKANAAAGLQCERRGITPVRWTEINERLNQNQTSEPAGQPG
jgi:bifunctional ADP-heptose synthase (sugar kinase/adenylyltransferase)